MYNDIDWTKQANATFCDQNSREVLEYAEKFPKGHWTFLGPGAKWYGTLAHKPEGAWNEAGEQLMAAFRRERTPGVQRNKSFGK